MTTPEQAADDLRDAGLRITSDNQSATRAMRDKATTLRFTADQLTQHAAELEQAAQLLDQRTAVTISDLNDTANIVRDLNVAAPTVSFPGDPGAGKIRWGAGIGGNADPVARHESVAGVPMGVRRTFWDMSKVSKLVSTCAVDHAVGRVPWVSVKLGTSWANVAAGKINAALIDLFTKLKALGDPVWFTAHHEPEGGNGTPYPDDGQGTEVHWRQMQVHVRNLLDHVDATNVAFAPILMSWTYDPRSKRNPLDWWVPGIWDFVGIDHYVDSESTMLTDAWARTRAFYADKGLRIAIGEWGNRGTDYSAGTRMLEWYRHLLEIGSPGCCYFDSGLNAPSGSWELKGDALETFRDLMTESASVRG